jgi:phosphomannomutase
MTNFIFDVDGTLTDSRKLIDKTFKNFMLEFTRMHTCYICTGSDRQKTIEQLGEDLTNQFTLAFHCSGNHIFKQDKEVFINNWKISNEEVWFLKDNLSKSNYIEKTGNHIEERIGTVNFSIVGRNANSDQRARYYSWDNKFKEREKIVKEYNEYYGHKSHAAIGGETSIDIFKLGCDKSQIKTHIEGETIYLGDKCYPGGNDYAISKLCDSFYQIDNGWKQTFSILEKITT